MQNCVDPNVINEVFVKHGVFSEKESPITGPAKGIDMRMMQMDYMLDNIRRHIGVNSEVLCGLIYSFQAVPDYNKLAIHLEGQLCIHA